jgi:hypothetical protein
MLEQPLTKYKSKSLKWKILHRLKRKYNEFISFFGSSIMVLMEIPDEYARELFKDSQQKPFSTFFPSSGS